MLKLPYLHIFLVFMTILCFGQHKDEERLESYTDVLVQNGKEPINFILEKIQKYDLIIFDDAWHPVVEPFLYYQELVWNPAFYDRVNYIFVEAFQINKQQHIDNYLETTPEDRSLLYPIFQDDFSGTGWPYKTYFDLMHTIYLVNQALPAENKLKVIAVNNPTYWSEIRTGEDLSLFRKTLVSADYTMYKTILNSMQGFDSGEKGIFLTNTRHAYKGIKDKNGSYFWNCGTFFYQWHPGKTYSVRFHNMALFIEKQKQPGTAAVETTAGMERISYRWVRMADGLWDSAFAANGNNPVAFSLKENVFGAETYIGNHMHKAEVNQAMYDAYDAIIFLAPLEELHTTMIVDYFYTASYKKELARRLSLLYKPERLQLIFNEIAVADITEYIEKKFVSKPAELIPQATNLGAMDAWRTRK